MTQLESYISYIGEIIESQFKLTDEDVKKGAEFCGDKNPVHYDEKHAKAFGFASVIASGAHTSTLFATVLTQYFETAGRALGLENSVRYIKPIFANQLMNVTWRTEDIIQKPSAGAYILCFKGEVMDEQGEVYLTGTSKVMAFMDKNSILDTSR